MSYLDFHKAKKEEKLLVFQEASKQLQLPAYAIEKDWWVVQTLRVIFQMEIGEHLLFKGGTSLSKAWGLINRFSEDIDLSLNRGFLGFGSGLISKSQVRKLRTTSFEYITEQFNNDFKTAMHRAGFDALTFDYENLGDGDQDPVSILVEYPAIIKHPEYIQPRVKVEIGGRSLKDPYSGRSFSSIIGKQFSDRPFADSAITIPCVNPERTYLEKLFLLHEEFQKPEEKVRVDRLSRHLYDLYQISQSEYKVKAHNPILISEIITHRERYSGMKGVDYKTHFPPNLNPIPPDAYIAAWKVDYRKMQEEMIPGDSPSFDDLIVNVKRAVSEFNNLKVYMY